VADRPPSPDFLSPLGLRRKKARFVPADVLAGMVEEWFPRSVWFRKFFHSYLPAGMVFSALLYPVSRQLWAARTSLDIPKDIFSSVSCPRRAADILRKKGIMLLWWEPCFRPDSDGWLSPPVPFPPFLSTLCTSPVVQSVGSQVVDGMFLSPDAATPSKSR